MASSLVEKPNLFSDCTGDHEERERDRSATGRRSREFLLCAGSMTGEEKEKKPKWDASCYKYYPTKTCHVLLQVLSFIDWAVGA